VRGTGSAGPVGAGRVIRERPVPAQEKARRQAGAIETFDDRFDVLAGIQLDTTEPVELDSLAERIRAQL
jgi:hypothetical protein